MKGLNVSSVQNHVTFKAQLTCQFEGIFNRQLDAADVELNASSLQIMAELLKCFNPCRINAVDGLCKQTHMLNLSLIA